MSDLHFHGIWRMDWGLGNPNKTAALIAILMLAVWALAAIRKWGFWVALTLFTGLGICLVHTFSRGGIIALFAGGIALLWFAPRPWPSSRIIALAISAWIIIIASLVLHAKERYAMGIVQQDRSITNRFEIWKVVPEMMVDAPRGWGIGHSGEAYMTWYQPLSGNEGYRTLVNSHLTWLVELGWPMRIAYVFLWGSLFLLCWPGRKWYALALASWIAFGVAATFSSVAESPWLWIIPVLGLLFVLISRFKDHAWPSWKLWMLPMGSSLVICGSFFVLGSLHPSLIQKSSTGVVIGKGHPQRWLIADSKVLGSKTGRTLRRFAEEQGVVFQPIGIVTDPKHLPNLEGDEVILAGDPISHDQLGKIFQQASAITLVNPAFFPQEIPSSLRKAPIKLVIGEFSQSSASALWKQEVPAHLLVGVGDYIPQWPSLLLKPIQ